MRKDKRPGEGAKTLGAAAALAGHAGSAVLLGAVLLAAILGAPSLQARAARTIGDTPARVVIDWPGPAGADQPARTWLGADIQSGLLRLGAERLAEHPDPLSGAGLEALGLALADTGWFASAPTVRREPGGVVRVSGTWRVPAAVVRHGGVDHLVARGGELLPPAYLPGQGGRRVILGASSPPPSRDGRPACGRVWGAGPGHTGLTDVQAGVALLNLIADKPWADQVAGVDVAAYARQRRLELVTARGTRVVWGGAPGEQVFGEASVETRLWRLAEINRRFGRIDAGRGSVDVSGAIATIDDLPSGPP